MTVSDIMKKKLDTIEEIASVQQTAEKMKEQNTSSLVVVDEKGKMALDLDGFYRFVSILTLVL